MACIVTTPTFISSETSESTDAPPRTGPSPQPPAQGNSEELQLQEEEDLQMAIAISLNEQENKVCPLVIKGFPWSIIGILLYEV